MQTYNRPAKPTTRPKSAKSSRTSSTTPRRLATTSKKSSTLKTGTTAEPVDPRLQEFFESMCERLTAGDGLGVATCFEYPALMVMSNVGGFGGSEAWMDQDAVAKRMNQAPEAYNARGIRETFPRIESVQRIGHDLSLVRTYFPYIDGDGNDMGDGESSVYVVRDTPNGYAIAAAITLGTDSDRADWERPESGTLTEFRPGIRGA